MRNFVETGIALLPALPADLSPAFSIAFQTGTRANSGISLLAFRLHPLFKALPCDRHEYGLLAQSFRSLAILFNHITYPPQQGKQHAPVWIVGRHGCNFFQRVHACAACAEQAQWQSLRIRASSVESDDVDSPVQRPDRSPPASYRPGGSPAIGSLALVASATRSTAPASWGGRVFWPLASLLHKLFVEHTDPFALAQQH